MKRRGRSRSDPLNYYESPKLRRALVVNLISAGWNQPWSASISSRIPTVILVVIDHQINYNWYNEPSAVSPFKSLKLRHAWLSLWDKHMTTGRINQVTCVDLISHKENLHQTNPTFRMDQCYTASYVESKPVSIPYISFSTNGSDTSLLQEQQGNHLCR